MRRLNGGLAILLVLAAGLATGQQNTGYPGYGCIQQGSLEVCMAQLTSDALYALFPRYGNPAFRWHLFTASVVSSDESVTAFEVTVTYQVGDVATRDGKVLLRGQGGQGRWTTFQFWAPLGAGFVAVEVRALRAVEVLELRR